MLVWSEMPPLASLDLSAHGMYIIGAHYWYYVRTCTWRTLHVEWWNLAKSTPESCSCTLHESHRSGAAHRPWFLCSPSPVAQKYPTQTRPSIMCQYTIDSRQCPMEVLVNWKIQFNWCQRTHINWAKCPYSHAGFVNSYLITHEEFIASHYIIGQ